MQCKAFLCEIAIKLFVGYLGTLGRLYIVL